MGCVKFAPKKNLNKFLNIRNKLFEGFSQISHSREFIKEKQLIFCRLWIKKFIDKKVMDHLHTFVVVARALFKLYSCSSSFISFQNQTETVIKTVAILVIIKE